MKTIIPGNLPPKLPNDFWTKLGQDQALLIYQDALKGTMQNGTSGHRYSLDYAKRKANYMRRFTKGEPLYHSIKTRKGLYFKNPKTSKGKRPNLLTGTQIVNNKVAFVNMELTGQTFRNLIKSPQALGDGEGIKISYDGIDAGKVLGNQDRGYDILGMRKENQDFTFKRILDEFDEKLRKEWEDNITITIG